MIRLSRGLDRAIADYTEAIRLTPKDADVYYNRSVARKALGDSAGADTDIAKARELNPNVGR
jgi:Flp pilus assembly protein TadD